MDCHPLQVETEAFGKLTITRNRKVKNEPGYIPPFKVGERILIRGTPDWDVRERARQAMGCSLISFGSIPAVNSIRKPWFETNL